MIKKLFLISFIFISLGAISHAENPNQQKFTEANQSYEKGEFESARDIYLDLYKNGMAGSALLYNLGNTYFRLGDRGNAVLWYERAQKTAPRDNDIQFNLKLASSHIKETDTFILEKIVLYFSEIELGLTSTILIWIAFVSLGLGFIRPDMESPFLSTVRWTSCLLLIVTVAWFGARVHFDNKPLGIVVSPPGEVRNGPGTDYGVGFTIPEGSRVIILNRREDWSQVGVPQEGLKGWMPTKEIELVDPSTV